MKKKLLCLFSFTLLIFLLPEISNAQGFVKFSTYLGGSQYDSVITSVIDHGNTYILASTTSANYPATNGSTYKGGEDAVVTKYDPAGNLVYSTYIGGSGDDNLYTIKVLNGEVFLAGSTTSTNYPVTNGSVYGGGINDGVYTKLNTSGVISFSGYYGGNDEDDIYYMDIANNKVDISGVTFSTNFPVVSGTAANPSGSGDAFLFSLNAATGSTIFSTALGGTNADYLELMNVDSTSGEIYLNGYTQSIDFPVTNSSVLTGYTNTFVAAYSSTGVKKFSTYLGGSGEDYTYDMQVVSGSIYLSGVTSSPDFPVTDGSVYTSNGNLIAFAAKLSATGSVVFAKYIGDQIGTGYDYPIEMQVVNNNMYVLNMNYDGGSNYDTSYTDIIKLDLAGNVIYSAKIQGTAVTTPNYDSSYYYESGLTTDMKIINGEVYVNGVMNGSGFPVTNGSTFYPTGTGYLTKLGTGGNIVFSELLGKMDNISPMQVANNRLYMLGSISGATYPATNGSHFSGPDDNMVFGFNTDGSTNFASYYGGTNNESIGYNYFLDNNGGYYEGLQVDSNYIYITGQTNSIDYPVTNNSAYKNNTDIFFTKIQLCPFDYDVTNDTLSPLTQTVCKQGLGNSITGKSIIILPTEAPALYRNGVASAQPNTEASYVWQVATVPTGPWTSITSVGAIKNYIPTGGSVNEYYRRLAITLADCGNPAIDTSDVVAVLVNSFSAPVVNAGGNFYDCPSSPITIGGTPTITGGNAPYSISWDMGAGTSSNPVVSPALSTIYTATVTDAQGCKQLGQAIVSTYKANAGIDKSDCAFVGVPIGGSPMSGLPGVTYSWSPATGLSNATAAQPIANPSVNTTYALTVTIPKTGGGTCSTTDDVIITPAAAPIANFAGPDQVICLGDSALLGLSSQAGYTYTWAPGSYLRSNTNSTTIFYPGPSGPYTAMPVPNPSIYYVTAKKAGCTFVDQVTVSTIEAWANYDGCGPRTIGWPDRTPNINETYSWTKDGGPSNFTGVSNESEVPVSQSIGGPTVYTLTTSYLGHTCTDQVTVDDCGCQTFIQPQAQYGCPNYNLNNGLVTLNAYSTITDATFSWSPAAGISSTTGVSVQLTDAIPRTYTVVATSMSDPTFTCFGTVNTNDPSSSLPVFTAPTSVTGCINQAVTIGDAGNPGYYYQWNGPGGYTNYFAPNISPILTTSSLYTVQVTDYSTLCTIEDTVAVKIEDPIADAGPDQTVCNSSIVKLGTPALPNTTYSWYPAASPWQNGTNQFSAQPQVLVASDQTFTLVASSPSGCTAFATVNVFINNNPTIAVSPDTTICLGGTAFIGTPAIPAVTYAWTPATGLNDPTLAQPTATPTINTIYTVVATFPGSCPLPASGQVFVTVSNPSFTLPDINFCPSGGPVALGNWVPAGMTNYSWTPGSLVSDNTIANPTTLNPPPSTTTAYTLQVTDTYGCTASNSVTIIPEQIAPIAGTNRAICVGSSTILGDAGNVTGAGISYQWSPATYLNNINSIQPTFTAVDPGSFTYTITKTNSIFGCSSIDTVVVTVNGFSLNANSYTLCQNSCKEIGDTALPGVQYLWSPATGLSDATIANPIACVGTSNAIYSLAATGPSGCTATATVLVSVYPTPAPQVSIPTVVTCSGTSSVSFNPIITPAATYNYLWSPNDASLSNIYLATPQIYLTSSGGKQYTLTVTNVATGCASTAAALLITNSCSTLGEIGDYVWYDNNQDGIQNVNEFGASGITVTAYNSSGTILAVAVTDITGHYELQNILPGTNYYIVFRNPSGYIFTASNVGGAAAINNSKADANGKTVSFVMAVSDTMTNMDAGLIPIGTPLPITLLKFTGQLLNNQVVLNWQTSAEYNNHYFIVEKSVDGVTFNRIGLVNGHGTTTLPHAYSFTDAQPASGHNYYRLIEVDYSNAETYSNVVDVVSTIHQSLTAVYLPEDHTILVTFDKTQTGNVLFNLFADNGQLISSVSAENIITEKINTNTLAAGVYMLQVVSNDINYTQKIFIPK